MRKSFITSAFIVATIFSLFRILSANTHSPWFLKNHAVDVAPLPQLDVIASTINSTHIIILDSECEIRRFTYSDSAVTSLGITAGFPKSDIDDSLCDVDWKPWRPKSSAAIVWNPLKQRLIFWKYAHDYTAVGHRVTFREFDGATITGRNTLDYTNDNILFFQTAFEYPSTSLYVDPTSGNYYGCAFNNGTLDPEGDGGFFIAKINSLDFSANYIFNMTQPVTSIQFNCNNIPTILCIFTTTRTVIEYKMSDLTFQRMYSLDSNALSLYFDPASIQVPSQNAMLHFHRMVNQSNQMVLQKINSLGFSLLVSTGPYPFSFPYGTRVYDVAISPSGNIYTAFTTMLNTSLSRGGTDIVLSRHDSSLQRLSSLVLSTVSYDNISRIFPNGDDAVLIVGVNGGSISQPNIVTNRQIFVAQFLYSDISVVSTSVPNFVMANETVSISFSSTLPTGAFSSLPRVTFGDKNCTNVQWNSSQLLARIPIGVGGPYDLAVSFDYLPYTPSTKTSILSYGQPLLQNVSPSQGLAAGYNITLTADKIGTPGANAVVVTVDGKKCVNVVYNIANTVTCTVPPGSGRDKLVIVSVGPVSNSTEPVFISYDPPVISQIQPTVGSTQGQNSIFIYGYNFGPCSNGSCDATVNDIRVTIGGQNCSALQQFNDTHLKCNAPEGVGVGHLVVLSVNGQTSAENIQYSYSPPTFSRVIPASVALRNPVVYLEGDSFGRASDIRTLVFSDINGTTQYLCPNVVWASHQNIRCDFTTVDLPLFSTFNISLLVGGQSNMLSPASQFKTGSPNSPPVALPYNSTVDEDTLLIIEIVIEDVDSDDLIQVYITSNPQNGSLYQITRSGTRGAIIDANSTTVLVADSFSRVMYIPSLNFHGSDSFYFKAKDRSNAESNNATANITILPVPDPPFPLSDEIQTTEDTPKLFVLRANYYDDPSNSNNSVSIMSLPTKGQLYYTQNMSSNSQDWFPINEVPTTLSVNTGIVFVPIPDENGVPYTRFTFAATDMVLNSTINATVTINVAPVNDPPVFNLSSVANITAKEDTEQVLVFDIGDVDMDNRLSVKITTLRINGTFFNIDRQTGLRSSVAVGEGSELTGPPYQLVYVPTPNYFSPNSSIDQTFNVVVTDTAVGGISFTHEIKFAVLPQNDAPELNCNPQSFVIPPDVLSGSVNYFNLKLMATDVDDSALEYVLREAPAMGELLDSSGRAINANDVFVSGNLTYRFNNSGGSYPFPNMTLYVIDSNGASSKPCTYEFTIACPPGKYNNICSSGYGPICDACPNGAVCSHDGKFPPRPQFGYWRSDKNLTYLPCFPAKACPGSEANSCAAGYESTRCGQCIKGYYRLGENCLECKSTNTVQIIIIAFCLFVLGPLLLLVSRSLRGGLSFAILSIAVNFIQTILIIRQLQIDWPPELHEVMNTIMVLNFNIEFASPECYLLEESLDFSAKMKLSLAIPLILGFAIASGFAIQYLCIYIYKNFSSGSNHFVDDIREHLSRFGRVIHVLLTFVYTSVTTHSLALFDCTQESDGQIYLDADRSLRCYENWWYRDLIFAIPAVCIYVIGIPAYFSVVSSPILRTKLFSGLYTKSKSIPKDVSQYDSSFKPEYQFFVVVQLFQKLTLIIVSMFLTRYIGLQIILNLAILAISFQLILKYRPYKFESLNKLELLSHLAAITVMSFGLPFHIDRSGAQSYKSFLTVFILFVIFGFNFVLLCVLLYELLRRRKSNETEPRKSIATKSVSLYVTK